MSEKNERLRRNKTKSTLRILFAISVLFLFVYAWLVFLNWLPLGISTGMKVFGFLFWIGCSTALGYFMQKEPNLETDSVKVNQENKPEEVVE